MCSIAASMATMAFNKFFAKEAHDFRNRMKYDDDGYLNKDEYNIWAIYNKAIDKGAMFDARVFNIPKEEVTNLIYWRQLDAIRNSIQMVGQANFSHKELHGKSCNTIKDMLMKEKDVDWDNLPSHQKHGSCCIKHYHEDTTDEGEYIKRTHWYIDKNIPVFRGEDRNYIDKLIFI